MNYPWLVISKAMRKFEPRSHEIMGGSTQECRPASSSLLPGGVDCTRGLSAPPEVTSIRGVSLFSAPRCPIKGRPCPGLTQDFSAFHTEGPACQPFIYAKGGRQRKCCPRCLHSKSWDLDSGPLNAKRDWKNQLSSGSMVLTTEELSLAMIRGRRDYRRVIAQTYCH